MLQFRLRFLLENNVLPKDKDKLGVSFLKASVMEYNKDMFDKLYDKSKSVIKTYTFSWYSPGARFEKTQITLDKNELILLFSDADEIELLHFFNAFQLMKYKKYPMNGNSMQLVSVHAQKLDDIKENEIVVRFQSPLIVRKHNKEDNSDIYYTYNMDGFEDALKDNVGIFLQKTGIKADMKGFGIQAVKAKKVVIPVFGRNTDATLGIFRITGSPELLNVLYASGMGARRSEAHGKFKIIG